MASNLLVGLPPSLPTPSTIKLDTNKAKSGDASLRITPTIIDRPTTNCSHSSKSPPSPTSNDRITQLEHNVHFLREQHQVMLEALHNEIEHLRNKNRDLLFELVQLRQAKPNFSISPDDISKSQCLTVSDIRSNTKPGNIEMLEEQLSELQIRVNHLDTHNTMLSNVVENQNQTITDLEAKLCSVTLPRNTEAELHSKLIKSQSLVSSLRRDIVLLKSRLSKEDGVTGDVWRESNTNESGSTVTAKQHIWSQEPFQFKSCGGGNWLPDIFYHNGQSDIETWRSFNDEPVIGEGIVSTPMDANQSNCLPTVTGYGARYYPNPKTMGNYSRGGNASNGGIRGGRLPPRYQHNNRHLKFRGN